MIALASTKSTNRGTQRALHEWRQDVGVYLGPG
jgi:hypothetical protein